VHANTWDAVTSVNVNISMVRYERRHLVCTGRWFTWTRMVDLNALIVWNTFIDIYFDKVKSLRIYGCLYEIPKNDLVDDMKLWPPVTSPDVYCYLIKTPGDFTWKKLQAYNFVISGWVKPLQVVKRNSGYDSHDATSPSSFPILPPTSAPPPF